MGKEEKNFHLEGNNMFFVCFDFIADGDGTNDLFMMIMIIVMEDGIDISGNIMMNWHL